MSVQCYPVSQTYLSCDDYEVWVNGECVALDTARVSAFPFNRRWPGYQRSKDQTELINFLLFAVEGSVTYTIRPRAPFDASALSIRPHSLGVTPTVSDGVITFTLDRPAYFTVEPYGRNHALHIFADPMPHYEVDKDADHVIYFGAGEHDAGLIEMTSGQTLFLDAGAVVYGAVHAIDADNIKILGRGILDHSRVKETIHFVPTKEQIRAAAEADEAVRNESRTPPILLEYCTNIEIDGITIRDSLMYNVRPIYCDNISIKNLKIIGSWRYNSDGIDMHNCENVHISDCFIRTYDDCICAKGRVTRDPHNNLVAATAQEGKQHDSFRHLLVERCVTWNDWGKALEIGAETRAEEICDITFRDCNVIHLCGPAMDCMNVDYADVHDVLFENITVETDEIIPRPRLQKYEEDVYDNSYKTYMPSLFTSSVEFHHEYSEGGQRRGINRNFTLRNVQVTGDKPLIFNLRGYDAEHLTHHIAIENLTHNGAAVTEPGQIAVRKNEFTADLTLEGKDI